MVRHDVTLSTNLLPRATQILMKLRMCDCGLTAAAPLLHGRVGNITHISITTENPTRVVSACPETARSRFLHERWRWYITEQRFIYEMTTWPGSASLLPNGMKDFPSLPLAPVDLPVFLFIFPSFSSLKHTNVKSSVRSYCSFCHM